MTADAVAQFCKTKDSEDARFQDSVDPDVTSFFLFILSFILLSASTTSIPVPPSSSFLAKVCHISCKVWHTQHPLSVFSRTSVPSSFFFANTILVKLFCLLLRSFSLALFTSLFFSNFPLYCVLIIQDISKRLHLHVTVPESFVKNQCKSLVMPLRPEWGGWISINWICSS